MSSIHTVIWFSCCLLLFSGDVVASNLPDILKKIRPSVVAIGTVLPTRSPKAKFSGTGFVIGDGHYIVTNLHVLPQVIDYNKKESLAVFVGRGKNATARKVKIKAKDERHDLALLEVKGTSLPALKIGDSSKVREGEEYAFTGYPIGMILGLHPVTHRGIISAITPIVIPAISSSKLSAKQIRSMRDPFNVFQLDAIAYPGNSGSPLYNISSGEVVGVVNSVFVKGTKEAILSNPSGIAYAIPAKYISKLAKEAGIDY